MRAHSGKERARRGPRGSRLRGPSAPSRAPPAPPRRPLPNAGLGRHRQREGAQEGPRRGPVAGRAARRSCGLDELEAIAEGIADVETPVALELDVLVDPVPGRVQALAQLVEAVYDERGVGLGGRAESLV